MKSFIRLVLIMILVAGCLAAAVGVWAVQGLPGLAQRQFGPPGAALSVTQRVIYAARVLAQQQTLLTPVDPQGKPRDFEVGLGESVNSVVTRLEEARLIGSADALRTYLVYSGMDTGVRAGHYELSPAMNAVEIGRAFQNALPPNQVLFNILPGWRVEEVAAQLPTSGLSITPDAFLQLVNDPPADLPPVGLAPLTELEGFLMPGPFEVKRDISGRDLVRLYLDRFDTLVTPEMRQGFTEHGLTLREAVILASMVQHEAVLAEEQPLIASVFYNRLAQGMKLDSDPTVQYAAGYDLEHRTWWRNPLTRDDLRINSRYNTYIYPGLPPGPIGSPSLGALRAVAEPAESGYFYFRAKCDGSGRHAFAVTYDEHLLNACP